MVCWNCWWWFGSFEELLAPDLLILSDYQRLLLVIIKQNINGEKIDVFVTLISKVLKVIEIRPCGWKFHWFADLSTTSVCEHARAEQYSTDRVFQKLNVTKSQILFTNANQTNKMSMKVYQTEDVSLLICFRLLFKIIYQTEY